MTQQLSQFVAELRDVQRRLLEMGTAAAEALQLAMKGLLHRDAATLGEVIASDRAIDQLQVDIEGRCLHVLALYQPVASDLRTVVATLRMSGDLERTGDLAVNISQAGRQYLRHKAVKPLIDVPRMGALASQMVRESLEASVSRQVSLAVGVLRQNAWLHALREQVFRELLTYMLSDAHTIEPSAQLLLIAQQLERVGDHATNIAEDVIFMVQGRDIRHRARSAPPGGLGERRVASVAPLIELQESARDRRQRS